MIADGGAPVLAVSGLAKALPGGRRLFDGLNLNVRAGELVAVIGESGAGKSTLLNILAGLDEAGVTREPTAEELRLIREVIDPKGFRDREVTL